MKIIDNSAQSEKNRPPTMLGGMIDTLRSARWPILGRPGAGSGDPRHGKGHGQPLHPAAERLVGRRGSACSARPGGTPGDACHLRQLDAWRFPRQGRRMGADG